MNRTEVKRNDVGAPRQILGHRLVAFPCLTCERQNIQLIPHLTEQYEILLTKDSMLTLRGLIYCQAENVLSSINS
jgi:hypothetical protein